MKNAFYHIPAFPIVRHHLQSYHSQEEAPSAETVIKLLADGEKCIPDLHIQPFVQLEIPKEFYVSYAEVERQRKKPKYKYVLVNDSSRTGRAYASYEKVRFNPEEYYYSPSEIKKIQKTSLNRTFYEVEQSCKKAEELRFPSHLHRKYFSTRKPPTVEALAEAVQAAKGRGKIREKIYVGSLLLDIEAVVNNSTIYTEDGSYNGRNPGIRGWLKDNCPSLSPCYKTLMHYKSIADKTKQNIGLGNSAIPVDVFFNSPQTPETEIRPHLTCEEIEAICSKIQVLLKTNEAQKSLDYFEALLFLRLDIRRYRSLRVRSRRKHTKTLKKKQVCL